MAAALGDLESALLIRPALPDRAKDWVETKKAGIGRSQLSLLTGVADQFRRSISAPRVVQHSHHGFVEFGAFSRVSRGVIALYPWNALPTIPETRPRKAVPTRDPLRLARYYQSLLDSGKFKTRADLARFLGVSRANVTQVLKRLDRDASKPSMFDSA